MAEEDSQHKISGVASAQPVAPDGRIGSADVFISYASADKAAAEAICAALERGGIVCWIAPRDVTPGVFYADAIVQGINSARILIVVLSVNSAGSQHVLREVERASAKRRPLVAFRLDDTPLPRGLEYFLSASHWLDASSMLMDRALPALLDAVRRLLVSPEKPAIDTGVRSESKPNASGAEATGRRGVARPISRRLWAVAAVVGVIVLATIGVKLLQSTRSSVARLTGPTAKAPAATVASLITEKSVAVLPFADMSQKKDQEYFSDGMSEEIIDLLVKIPDLRVPARTSSFYFKGKPTKIPDIARELGVANVLEGSVRRFGNHLRVTAQLVRADNGYHIWSETYDRQMTDVLMVQDEIAIAVVKALKASLLDAPVARTVTPSGSEAYTIYLQGRSIFAGAGTAATANKGVEYLEKSTKLNSEFAPAWATLSRAYVSNYIDYGRGPLKEVRDAAYGAAARAIKLDPLLAEAHLSMGRVLMTFDWDWREAEREISRALMLDPSNADVARNAYYLSVQLGRFEEAIQHAKSATMLDPLNYYNYYRLADAEYYGGNLAEAEANYRKALEFQPDADGLHWGLANVLLRQGKIRDALAEMRLERNDEFRDTNLPRFLDAVGQHGEADQTSTLAASKYGDTFPFDIGEMYASRHDFDRAFSWWDRAFSQHNGVLSFIKLAPTDTGAKELSLDPRYKDLLRKMNLPD